MISSEDYQRTAVFNKQINTLIRQIYVEWQEILIANLGRGLCNAKGVDWYDKKPKAKKIYAIDTVTFDEKEVYINARKEGALKIPVAVLSDPNWKEWLEKKLEKQRNKVFIKILSEE